VQKRRQQQRRGWQGRWDNDAIPRGRHDEDHARQVDVPWSRHHRWGLFLRSKRLFLPEGGASTSQWPRLPIGRRVGLKSTASRGGAEVEQSEQEMLFTEHLFSSWRRMLLSTPFALDGTLPHARPGWLWYLAWKWICISLESWMVS
jgi:hypothetical protein